MQQRRSQEGKEYSRKVRSNSVPDTKTFSMLYTSESNPKGNKEDTKIGRKPSFSNFVPMKLDILSGSGVICDGIFKTFMNCLIDLVDDTGS